MAIELTTRPCKSRMSKSFTLRRNFEYLKEKKKNFLKYLSDYLYRDACAHIGLIVNDALSKQQDSYVFNIKQNAKSKLSFILLFLFLMIVVDLNESWHRPTRYTCSSLFIDLYVNSIYKKASSSSNSNSDTYLSSNREFVWLWLVVDRSSSSPSSSQLRLTTMALTFRAGLLLLSSNKGLIRLMSYKE